MVDQTPVSFLKAMMVEFKRSEQTTAQFADEIKALSEADKLWYRQALIDHGYKLI